MAWVQLLFASVVILSSPSISKPAHSEAPYANELYAECTGSPIERNACIAYLLGVYDGLTTLMNIKATNVCLHANGVNGEQLLLIFVRWGQTHPESLNVERGYAVAASFLDAFPCKQK